MTPAPERESWRFVLHAFLGGAFSADELHVFIGLHYPDLRDALPMPVVGRGQFAFAVIDALDARGHLTASLFASLARERPGRRTEIEAIRARWADGDSPPGDPHDPPFARFEGPHGVAVTAVADFIGRADALDELARDFADETTACIVVAGIGGIGKTTLVRQFVARRGPACFPDGAAWLDGGNLLRDLSRVARRFGWTERRDPTPDEATALLRRTLAPRRFLLVVDGFDPDGDLAHIPVLGGSCRTLVTSRKTTLDHGLPDARALEVELWSADDCREFLRRAGPRVARLPDAELDALAVFVGYLPLGVRLVASFLVNRPSLSATAALAALRRQPLGALEPYRGRYPGLVATFQAAWDTLDAAQQRVLAALAACASQTRGVVIAAVAAVEDPSATLDDLAVRSLVQHADATDSSWGLHDVVRMFVAAQPSAQAFAQAHVAWVEAHLAAHHDPLQHVEFAAGVAEATRAFARLLDDRDIERAAEIYRPLEDHLDRVGQLGEALAIGEALLHACLPGSGVAADCLNRLGLTSRKLGDMRKAIDCHEHALAIEEQLGRESRKARNLGNLGSCYQTLGDLGKAIELYERAIAIDERRGDAKGQARNLGNLGSCYRRLGDLTAAVAHHERALALDEQLHNLEGQANQLGNLGSCHQTLGDIERAIGYHQRALALDERLGRLEGQASNLGNLGSCYRRLGDLAKAIDHHERGLAIDTKLVRLEGQASHLGNLGSCYWTLGEPRRAIEFHTRALALDEYIGRLEGRAIRHANLGLCHESLGEVSEALNHFQRALESYRRMGLSDTHPSIARVLAAVLRVSPGPGPGAEDEL